MGDFFRVQAETSSIYSFAHPWPTILRYFTILLKVSLIFSAQIICTMAPKRTEEEEQERR